MTSTAVKTSAKTTPVISQSPLRQKAPGVDAADAEIDEACTELRLPSIRERYVEIAEQAVRDRATYKGFLLELLRAECLDRDERRRQRLLRDAAFHRPKRLEDFDYDKNPQVSPAYVNQLADPAWVLAGRPLCLIGNSGTGKSHLLIGIGTAIAEAGLRVRYITTANLVNELAEAQAERRLSRSLAKYARYDLLCLDEFGYLSLDATGAKLLFMIFTEREERKAIGIASNAPFGEWGKTFRDERLCAAIVDRLTFNGFVIETGEDSYRLQATLDRQHG